METFSASQRPVTRSCVVFCDLRLNKRLSKQTMVRLIWDAISLIMTSLWCLGIRVIALLAQCRWCNPGIYRRISQWLTTKCTKCKWFRCYLTDNELIISMYFIGCMYRIAQIKIVRSENAVDINHIVNYAWYSSSVAVQNGSEVPMGECF